MKTIYSYINHLLLLAIASIILIGCSMNETWIGFYYPNENNLLSHKQSGELKSLEECQDWVDTQIQLYNPSGYGYDYECGRNCKMSENYGLYTCKETAQ